jgi:hypothetical protein
MAHAADAAAASGSEVREGVVNERPCRERALAVHELAVLLEGIDVVELRTKPRREPPPRARPQPDALSH